MFTRPNQDINLVKWTSLLFYNSNFDKSDYILLVGDPWFLSPDGLRNTGLNRKKLLQYLLALKLVNDQQMCMVC